MYSITVSCGGEVTENAAQVERIPQPSRAQCLGCQRWSSNAGCAEWAGLECEGCRVTATINGCHVWATNNETYERITNDIGFSCYIFRGGMASMANGLQ